MAEREKSRPGAGAEHGTLGEDKLIEDHIEPDPAVPGVEEARTIASGVPVWALVGHLRAIGGDVRQLAEDYEIPPAEVDAAMAYYRRHKAAVDARIAANAA